MSEKFAKIILIGGLKGGTGKTTMSTNLVVVAKKRGLDVLYVDSNKIQQSASRWADLRDDRIEKSDQIEEDQYIPTVQMSGKGVYKDLRSFQSKYDLIVIDTGGEDSPEFRSAGVVSTKLCVFVRPSEVDVLTANILDGIITDVKAINPELPVSVYFNAVNPNPNIKELDSARTLWTDSDTENLNNVSNVVIYDRIAIRKAWGKGMGVVEYESQDKRKDHKAIAEIEALYDEIIEDKIFERSN